MGISEKYIEKQLKKLSEVLSNNIMSSMLTVHDFTNRISEGIDIEIYHDGEHVGSTEYVHQYDDHKVIDFTILDNCVELVI